MTGWAKVKDAAKYAGISERTLRGWLKTGLKYSQLSTGTILVKIEWVDDFLQQYEVTENRVDQVVAEVMKNLEN